MPSFHYSAIGSGKAQKRGIIEAETLRAARDQLRSRGLVPLTVEPASGRTGGWRGRGISLSQRLSFTRQLAALLRGAVPLSEALDIIARQSEVASIQSTVSHLAARLREGQSFADALRGCPSDFPEFYIANIAGAERAGMLDNVLEQLADVLEKEHASRQKLLLALIYPTILVIASLGVAIFLLVYVVPALVSELAATGSELPRITQVVLAISDAAQAAAPLAGLVILIAVVAVMLMRRQSEGRLLFDRWLLAVPGLGKLFRTASSIRFGRTVSMLYGSGIQLPDALAMACEGESNARLRIAIERITEHVRDGAKLHVAMEQEKCFPLMFTCMVSSGEESGRLKELMEHAADYHDREINQRITLSIRLLEPLILLLVGGVVLLVVIAVLLPIMNLNQTIG